MNVEALGIVTVPLPKLAADGSARRGAEECSPTARLAILSAAASVGLACGDPQLTDDRIERRVSPAMFLLGESDDSAEFEIAACTNGEPDDFYGHSPTFEMRVAASASAAPPTGIRVVLDPPDNPDQGVFQGVVADQTDVVVEADFGPEDPSADEWCSGWGTYTLSRIDTSSTARIHVKWTITVSVLTVNEPSLDVYVR